jgi:ATP-dependent exoDNAse (exonuclease V) alpha subunit
LNYAEDHIFERVSVCHDHELLAEALRHGRGQISHKELKGSLALQESTKAILRDGDEIATVASLKREREIIDCINRGIVCFERLCGERQFTVSDHLNPEQKKVVEFVLDSRDRAVNISGAAGTGKTAALQELNRALHDADRKVLAVAPTVSAVEELQKVGFSDAITIERLLQDPKIRGEMQDRVIIVDEAGMVSGRQMSELLRLTEQNRARLVFSGDTHQIQSVEAGDALRILEKESRLKSIGLTKIKRQTEKGYREAIQELRRNPEQGFEKLDAIGAVREVSYLDRAQAIAEAYTKARGQNALVVCATHDEIDHVTEAIRSARKKAGKLGKSVQVTRDVSQNWTTVQKSEMRNFQPGQLLGFHRAVKGIEKNETVEVLQVKDKNLIVRNEKGQTQTVTPRQAKSFDVFERKNIEIASDDRLLLTANYRTRGFRSTNGEIVTVSHLDSKGRIHLEDGRTLPCNFRQFTHGYAVTAHRSQGKSVDSVIISADRMQKELFYVAASRGRKIVLVVTSDKQSLRESVARSGARQSASELARKAKPGYRWNIYRGLDAARELARRTAWYVSTMLRRPRPQLDLTNKPELKLGVGKEHDCGISR